MLFYFDVVIKFDGETENGKRQMKDKHCRVVICAVCRVP